MLSQLYFNRTLIGFLASLFVHILLGYYIYENHKILKIKPGEEKPLKIDILSYKPVSVPVFSEQIIQTPPAPPPPSPPVQEVVKKHKPKEHKKPEKIVKKPLDKPKIKPKQEIKQEITPPAEIEQPTQTEQVAQSTPQSTPQNVPQAPSVGEFNMQSSAGDENFAKIRAAIEKHKKYPKNAQKMRQQGKAEVQFLYKKDGLVTAIKILKSSGFSSLDDGAIKCIERAVIDFPRLDRDYLIRIPIGFRLI